MDYLIDLTIVGLSLGMVYGLVALGISFIYSGLDIVHFAHGEIYMIGAFLGVTVLNLTGLNYPALIVVAMVLTGLIGAGIERLFYRRLTREGGGISFAGMGIIIAGFGISLVLQNAAFLIWSAKAVPMPVNFGLPLEFGDFMLPRSYLWIVGITLLLMATLHVFLKYTRLGLAVRAVAHNKDIAYLMGINVPLTMSILFGIGCAMGAAAGVLIGPINYVQVSMGIGILIKAFAAAVVGGFGNLPGA
ncbi:MAG: branched-chain amino acid ABC transporter permease, partial [Xanthobacteraceae bacterium]|nr:branched-chain amino acid ABC transporter permease [Xanthobacteraceae bacterium]